MYSKNDYRYYLERQLLTSGDYLAHYGVMGMKWGVRHDERRAGYVAKKQRNQEKINTYTKQLNTVGAQKRAARAAKYQHKVDKLQRKASKAQARLAKGKTLSSREQRRIAKYEKYKAKVAKNSVKNDKYQMKISKLQARNARLDKKIAKMDRPSRSGARAYQRGLNSLDKKMLRINYKYTNIKNAQQKAKLKSDFTAKAKESSATLKDAKKRGYDVSARETSRWVNPAESIALGVATAALPTPVGYTRVVTTKGTKYKVRTPKKKK